MRSDSEWLTALRRCDSEAFRILVDRFEGPLYRYFLASHGDPQLAGEQSADCFGDLVSALPKMKGGIQQLQPFVFAVARNVLRRRWRVRAAQDLATDVASELIDTGALPAAVAESREEVSRLLAALQDLDHATREAFILRYVEQLPVSDVARAVGEPEGTVKSRLHRARKKLENLLGITEKP